MKMTDLDNSIVNEMRSRRDAYQRDYDSSVSGFGRGHDHRGLEQELAHETNNYAVSINGKAWKVFGTRSHAEAIARKIQMKDPSKKVSVHETGAEISEVATAGGTSAGMVSVGAVHKNQSPKMQKPTDNALDGNNLMTGGSIKR